MVKHLLHQLSQPQHKNLWRTLLQMKAQVASIALVVTLGVGTLFGFTSTYRSLEKARDQFYERSKFADVFIAAKKVPETKSKALKAIPGIQMVETRISQVTQVEIKGFEEPIIGKLISLPSGQQPKLNRLHLKKGRLPQHEISTEVVVNEGFAGAHNLSPGDTLIFSLNGRKESFQVSGIAVSPEFIFAMGPAGPMPDDAHYGVFWLNRDVLEASYDMKASFNEASFKVTTALQPLEQIKQEIDHLLEKYGRIQSIDRSEQVSHLFVNEEIKQLRIQATTLPMTFFLVAAFILNVIVGRMVAVQRGEIATLKALGLYDKEIAAFYYKLSLLIVALGSFGGFLLGGSIGRSMTRLYTQFYHFPQLTYDFAYSDFFFAVLLSSLTALFAVHLAIRQVLRLRPAEAMRPPPPPSFHKRTLQSSWFLVPFDLHNRMALRGLLSHPARSIMTGIGMSLAIVLLISGLFWIDSMEQLVDSQYSLIQKETATVSLTHPLSVSAVLEIERLEGVLQAEGYRMVPVIVSHGHTQEKLVFEGWPKGAQLRSLRDKEGQVLVPPQGELIVSQPLAQKLGLLVGDKIDVEFLGSNPTARTVTVDRIVDGSLSPQIVTSRSHLNKLIGESPRIDTVLFRSAMSYQKLYKTLNDIPRVLTVSFKDAAVQAFTQTSAQFIIVFALILSLFAGAITFAIVYNNARVSLTERDWELATLRILGFYKGEVFRLIAQELLILTLVFLPVGWLLGYLNSWWLIEQMTPENLNLPFVIHSRTYMIATFVASASTLLSGALVYGKVRKLDLTSTLKSRN